MPVCIKGREFTIKDIFNFIMRYELSLIQNNKKIRDAIVKSLRQNFTEVYTSFVGLSPDGFNPILSIKTGEQDFEVRAYT